MNAADAFDIGNFDDDDTKGIKVSETIVVVAGFFFCAFRFTDHHFMTVCWCELCTQVQDDDQRLYRRFNLLVSDSWQAEMLGRSRLWNPNESSS